MILLDYILLGVILLALGIIIFITVKKFPIISSINTQTMKKERHQEVKKELIERRLTRKLANFGRWLGQGMVPLKKKTKIIFEKLHKRVVDLEQHYSRKVQEKKNIPPLPQIKNKINVLLEEASELKKSGNFKEAEKKCIEAISLDKNSFAAFYLLGEIYMDMKEYNFAHETFSHLLMIDPKNAMVYHDLGLLAKLQSNAPLAIKNFQKALQLEPNNPKILDSLLETCLEFRDKVTAWECLDKLKEVNPDNQKIQEFEVRVKELEKKLKIKKI